MSFSNNHVKAFQEGQEQRTEDITFTADSLQSITMQLPKGVVFHNLTTGKNSAAGILCAGGKEGQELFPCAAAGDVGNLSSKRQIPSGEYLQQTAGEEGKKGILLPCGRQYPVQG